MAEYELRDGILQIAQGTTYIGSQEFAQREDIRTVYFPEGLRYLEDECFAECPNIERVIFASGMQHIGPAAFADCTALYSISLPDTLKTIESGAFLFNEALKSISLPESLESIGEMAFQNSGLIQVKIPEKTMEIQDAAFFSCEKLRRVDVLNPYTQLGRDAFGSCYQLTEGFVAPGYPEQCDAAAELLYTLLWCSCPDRHTEETSQRARHYIKNNQQIILERILKNNNVPAMTGVANLQLLDEEMVTQGLDQALKNGYTELSALFLKLKRISTVSEEDFTL